jgi:multisubunit Na+/H+ antiporter MnhB subunit
MGNKHTSVQATNQQGEHVSIQQTSTDSPILPAANLQQLQQIDPKLVDWVVEQTKVEADHRRKIERQINWFVFIERMSGVLAGAAVAIFGLGISAYLVLHGHEWAGVAVSGTTLATIVTVLVTKDHRKVAPKSEPQQSKPRGRRK